MPNRRARVLHTKTIYEGSVFSVRQDRIAEPGGIRVTRDIVAHRGSVVLLPIFPDGSILLVRQYRHAIGARRELIEETGYTASRLKPILEIFPSPGFVTEHMWIFAATGLKQGRAQPEEDERITARTFSLGALEKMIRGGSLHDGKSVAAILFYSRFLK
jgi:ADP-ribose pyrophosphatase